MHYSFSHRLPLPLILFAAVGCICGISVTYLFLQQLPVSIVPTTGFCCFIACLLITTYRSLKKILMVYTLFFFIALVRFYILTISLHHSTHELEGKILSGSGIIISQQKGSNWLYRSTVTLKLIQLDTIKLPPYSLIKIFLSSKTRCQPGDLISFHSLSFTPQTNKNYLAHLHTKGIIGAVFCKKFNFKVISSSMQNWRQLQDKLRKRISTRFQSLLSIKTYALFSALFLGAKTDGLFNLRTLFMWWGVVHYLARSGLHVVVLVGTWRFIFTALKIPYIFTQIVMTLFILLYSFLSWSSISFERAVASFLVYQAYVLGGKSFQMIHLICLVTIFMLLWNPLILFCLDFQLSFGLTFALSIFNEIRHQIRIHLKKRAVSP